LYFFQNYDTSESKLRREFEFYGPIKKIIVIHNSESGKPRGYAFIEYEHERDMHCEYRIVKNAGVTTHKRVVVIVDVLTSVLPRLWFVP
jgi:U1 small nuclear ribonucleoprotein 70kDa